MMDELDKDIVNITQLATYQTILWEFNALEPMYF